MSVEVMNLVWKNAPYSKNTMLTLLALADWSNDEGVSWPSVLTLAKKSRQSERQCQRCIDQLHSDGMVSMTERSGTSSLYRINLTKLNGGQDVTPATDKAVTKLGQTRDRMSPYTSDTSDTPYTPKPSGELFSESAPLPKKGFVLPSWVPEEAWYGYVDMRKKIKKPLTDRAAKLVLRKLDALRFHGNDPEAVLDQSTEHCWQGIFELKNAPAKPQSSPTESLSDQILRIKEGR